MIFDDRHDAGRRLGQRLRELDLKDPVVLALPRGGVSIGVEVAKLLGAPLDIVLVRKIGAPGQEELAAGAVVDGATPELVRNEDVIRSLRIDSDYLERQKARQLTEIERRRRLYLGDRPRAAVAGRTAIIVDDGIATGATVRAALHAVRRTGPLQLVLAVPVAAAAVLHQLQPEADRIVCLHTPRDLLAVGEHYRDFTQVEDDEVVAMLAEAAEAAGR